MERAAFIVNNARATALRALNYSPEVERLRANKGKTIRLREVISAVGPAYGTVFTRVDCSSVHGVELLSQSDMFGAEPNGRPIRRDSMAKPERHLIRRWQVLIAGAGTLGENELYGRCLIADGRLVGKYVGPDALAITFTDEESDLSLYCYAFLASGLGVRALRATSYGTKILRLRSDMVADLPVPVPDDRVLKRVAALVRTTVEQRELYASSLAAARRLVEELPAMQEAHEMCGGRRARCIEWAGKLPTMGAWNYVSTGSALAHLLNKWNGRLGDIVPQAGLFNGPRFARVEVQPPHGVEFLSQRDVFLIKPVPRRIAHPGFSDEKLYVPEGSILVGGHGTLGEGEIFGRCAFVTRRLSRAAFTQDLLRVQPRAAHTAQLYAFLSTMVGLRLLRSTAVGTKILSLRLDLLRALPIPDLTPAQAGQVNNLVSTASAAREQAESAELDAVRIIEEEVLPQWLA